MPVRRIIVWVPDTEWLYASHPRKVGLCNDLSTWWSGQAEQRRTGDGLQPRPTPSVQRQHRAILAFDPVLYPF
jgi:hypothetical protein